jgi:hypothetical protein
MSALSNPKLAGIDDALTELEPFLVEFGRSHGFKLARSHEGSFNIPRRWLYRESDGTSPIRYEIGLVIALEMSERLERGFFPEIPCTLYITAHDREACMYYHAAIVEAQPFSSLKDSLSDHLGNAGTKLKACTRKFISEHGSRDPAA